MRGAPRQLWVKHEGLTPSSLLGMNGTAMNTPKRTKWPTITPCRCMNKDFGVPEEYTNLLVRAIHAIHGAPEVESA